MHFPIALTISNLPNRLDNTSSGIDLNGVYRRLNTTRCGAPVYIHDLPAGVDGAFPDKQLYLYWRSLVWVLTSQNVLEEAPGCSITGQQEGAWYGFITDPRTLNIDGSPTSDGNAASGPEGIFSPTKATNAITSCAVNVPQALVTLFWSEPVDSATAVAFPEVLVIRTEVSAMVAGMERDAFNETIDYDMIYDGILGQQVSGIYRVHVGDSDHFKHPVFVRDDGMFGIRWRDSQWYLQPCCRSQCICDDSFDLGVIGDETDFDQFNNVLFENNTTEAHTHPTFPPSAGLAFFYGYDPSGSRCQGRNASDVFCKGLQNPKWSRTPPTEIFGFPSAHRQEVDNRTFEMMPSGTCRSGLHAQEIRNQSECTHAARALDLQLMPRGDGSCGNSSHPPGCIFMLTIEGGGPAVCWNANSTMGPSEVFAATSSLAICALISAGGPVPTQQPASTKSTRSASATDAPTGTNAPTGTTSTEIIIGVTASTALAVLAVATVLIKRRRHGTIQCTVAAEADVVARQTFLKEYGHILPKGSEAYETAAHDAAFESLAVSMRDISEGQRLGHCSFGFTFTGLLKSTPVRLKATRSIETEVLVSCLVEARLLTALAHPNVERVLGVIKDAVPMVLVLERLENGTLLEFLRSCRPTASPQRMRLDESAQATLLHGIACGCAFVSQHKVVHRAICAENILVGAMQKPGPSDNVHAYSSNLPPVKVANFGHSKEVYMNQEYLNAAETRLPVRWMAVEALTKGVFSVKSDVWAFGVVMWEVLTLGKTPFGVLDSKEIATEVVNGRVLEQPAGCPVSMASIMERCFESDYERRPGFNVVEGELALLLLPGSELLFQKQQAAKQVYDQRTMASWDVSTTNLTEGKTGQSAGCSEDTFNRLSARCNLPPIAGCTRVESVLGSGQFATDVWATTATSVNARSSMEGSDDDDSHVRLSTATVAGLKAEFETVLVQLDHGHLLKLIGTYRIPTDTCITVLHARPELGTLASAIASGKVKAGAEGAAVALGVGLGLEYLHGRFIVHGRVTSTTSAVVGLDPEGNRPKGMIAAIEMLGPLPKVSIRCHAVCVTGADPALAWMGPEAVTDSEAGFPSDVHAFGTLLWEACGSGDGAGPALGLSGDALLGTLRRRRRPPLPLPLATLDNGLSNASAEGCCEVITACRTVDPAMRPSLAGALTALMETLDGADRLEIPETALTKLSRLGGGQFGEVLSMILRKPGAVQPAFVAVKMLKYAITASSAEDDPSIAATAKRRRADFLAEAELMKRMRHPNLVRLVGIVTASEPLMMILEYLPGGALDVWMYYNGKATRQETLLWFLHQIALGMSALAALGVVHRDLVRSLTLTAAAG